MLASMCGACHVCSDREDEVRGTWTCGETCHQSLILTQRQLLSSLLSCPGLLLITRKLRWSLTNHPSVTNYQIPDTWRRGLLHMLSPSHLSSDTLSPLSCCKISILYSYKCYFLWLKAQSTHHILRTVSQASENSLSSSLRLICRDLSWLTDMQVRRGERRYLVMVD